MAAAARLRATDERYLVALANQTGRKFVEDNAMRDLRFWRWRQAGDDEAEREIEAHFALAMEVRLQAGFTPRDARVAARREFGSVALIKEELRDMRTGTAVERLWRDVRHAGRRLCRSPAFTAATTLTLALAIAANVTVFALVERVLLNPLPYPDSGRLVMLDFAMPGRNISSGFNSITTRQYFHYAAHARTLAALAVYRNEDRTLTGQGTPERIRVARTTPSLTAVLRITPEIGRWLPAGPPRGAAPTVVLSHNLWRRRFAADPGVLGRVITLDGAGATVVGVMPPGFAFPDARVDVWATELFPATSGDDSYSFTAAGRLADSASLNALRAEITSLTRALHAEAQGNGYDALVSTALPLRDFTVGGVSSALWVLLASAAGVLLIAFANITNLFLVRAEARQREVAVRSALGAGQSGIARFFLAESAILSAGGGALGLLASWYGVTALVAAGPANLPRLHELRLAPNHVLVTLGLTALAALTFGLVPLLRLAAAARPLHESSRGATAARQSHRARRLLMGGQIALALVLLVASGLLTRSFVRLRAVDPGFDSTSALTFQIGLPRADYPERERVVRTHEALLDRLAALPGVASASAVNCVPLSGRGFCGGAPIYVEGGPPPGPSNVPPIVAIRPVAARFFETMGMPLVAGRGITEADFVGNALVAVVNDTLVRQTFPGGNPLGKRVRLAPHAQANVWFTIVGVVKTTPTFALAEPRPAPKMYVPMLAARNVWPSNLEVMTYVLRTSILPNGLAAAAAAAVKGIDPNLALAEVRSLQNIMDAAAAPRALTMTLVVLAALTALLLGVIGIYGAMSYIVSQRSSEIGVRLALGAEPANVARMIVGEGALIALAGITVGLTAAVGGGRLIQALLFGVSPRDPGVFAGTAALLLTVVLLACWLPARRAARLNPLEALRAE